MSSYRWGVADRLSLDEIDLGFRRYRLQRPEAEQAMLRSLRQYEGQVTRSWDPRMSSAGNRISRQLAMLLDLLAAMQSWLRYSGRGQLQLCDREPLRPGFERLTQEAHHVAELTDDFLKELHLP